MKSVACNGCHYHCPQDHLILTASYQRRRISPAPEGPAETAACLRRLTSGQMPSRLAAVVQPVAAGFDWSTTAPPLLRPWRPVYHISMGLQAASPTELVLIDRNYKDRILLRRLLLREHASTCMGSLDAVQMQCYRNEERQREAGKGLLKRHQQHPLAKQARAAVVELYEYLLAEYLPQRYPRLFSQDRASGEFVNHVTGARFPLSRTAGDDEGADTLEALRTIGETIEDDCFLVCQTDAGHVTVAFVCCFPAGFDPGEKLGRVLADIHGPVPAFEKIGRSMERFFGRLDVEKSVKRVNWSVMTQPECSFRGEPTSTREMGSQAAKAWTSTRCDGVRRTAMQQAGVCQALITNGTANHLCATRFAFALSYRR